MSSTPTTKTRTYKYTRRLRYTEGTLLKLKIRKNLKYTVSENKHTDKDKNNQIHSQIKMHLMNITKIDKYEKTEQQC